MNRSDETLFDARIADWLEDDPHTAPDQALDVVLAAFPSINQRRAWRVPWRFPEMSSVSKLVAAVATVVIVAVGGVYLLAPRLDNSSGGPTPSPTLPPTPSPSPEATPSQPNALLDTSTWVEYTSDRYGFTLKHPSGWEERPADHDWTLEGDAPDWLSSGQDAFIGPNIRVSAWSVPFENDPTVESSAEVEAWVRGYCEAGGTPCTDIHDRAVPLCIEVRDCHPGLLIPFASDVQAFFTGGIYPDDMHVVTVWWGDSDPAVAPFGGSENLLEAFLSTMCVWPEATRPAPSAC